MRLSKLRIFSDLDENKLPDRIFNFFPILEVGKKIRSGINNRVFSRCLNNGNFQLNRHICKPGKC